MPKILLRQKLDEMTAVLKSAGIALFGPRIDVDRSSYGPIDQAVQLALDLVLPDRTLKELFFPRSEPILQYSLAKQKVDLRELSAPDQPRVIFGARPCDAAALAVDDPLFGWDYKDDYWFTRRSVSTIVTVACTKADDFCMCTSLKLAPDSPLGSDVLLRPLDDQTGWRIEEITDKGREFVRRLAGLLDDSDAPTAPVAEVPEKFNLDRVLEALKSPDRFDDTLWAEASLRCLGCGACTYLCPTCHCFDIQDEGDTYRGVRRKNWDSCSFPTFTLHTSGHNPRPNQAARWRQRIFHKFNYYPGKFERPGCTGCGRCTRQCPVDMGVTETLQELAGQPRSQ